MKSIVNLLFVFKLCDFMKRLQAENAVDPIVMTVIEFSLNLGWNAVKDGH